MTFLLTHIFIRIVASLGVIDPMSGPKIKDEDTRNISSPEDDEETAVKLFKVTHHNLQALATQGWQP